MALVAWTSRSAHLPVLLHGFFCSARPAGAPTGKPSPFRSLSSPLFFHEFMSSDSYSFGCGNAALCRPSDFCKRPRGFRDLSAECRKARERGRQPERFGAAAFARLGKGSRPEAGIERGGEA